MKSYRKHVPGSARAAITSVAVLFAICFGESVAFASSTQAGAISKADSARFQLLSRGGLLNRGGRIQLGWNSSVTGVAFNSPAPQQVPEPGTLVLLGTGFVACAGLLRRSSKSRPSRMRNGP